VNFHDYLIHQLMLVDIKVDMAIELAPHLRAAQFEAMLNSD